MDTEGTEYKIMCVRGGGMKSSAAAYGVSLAAVAVAVVARLLLEPLLAERLPFITLFLAVGFAAWYGGRGPGLLALVAGAVAAAFFLTQPRYSFAIDQTEFQVGLVLYGVVGFASIAMLESLRKAQRQTEEQRRQLEQEVAARRLTEQAFAEQAERLRTTLASIGDAVITTDLAGCITNMNAVAESLTGWTTAEAMGQLLDAVFRIVNETTRKTVENPAFRALKEGVIVGLANHTVLIAKDGTERPIDDSAAPIRCKDGEVVGCVLVFRDITERHRQEAELEERERQFRTLAESIPQLAWMANTDGYIFWYNRRWYEYTGTTPEQMEGWGWQSVHDPDELPKVLEQWKASIATGTPFDMMFPLKGQDGQFRPFLTRVEPVKDDEGRVVRWFGTNTDVTEQMRVEERLRFQLDLTQTITDNATIAIFMTDDKSRCTFMNPAAEAMTGFTFKEVEGGILHDFIHHHYPDGRPYPIPECPIDRALPERFDVIGHEDVFIRKSGEYFPALVNAKPIRKEGRAVGTVIEVRDVRVEKEAAEALRLLAANLSEANRKKDEFLATLAHELRNPLAPIRNGLLLMKLAGDDAEAVERSRSMMERQIEQMVRLVDDLMDISRISQGKLELRKEHVPLGAVIASAVETTRPLIEQMGHELTVTLPKQPLIVDADMTRLAQVFMNLLNNSAKYSERGGHIWLTVERQGSDVVVSVRDTGIGIPADNLTSIFDMFSQVDRSLEKSQGGLGIGLSLVKRLVEMHGGRIEAKSDGPGRGSEFVVRLPVDVEASRPQAADKQEEPAASKSSLRILIVDDNKDGADSLAMVLKMMGNDARTAYDGKEGVELAGEFRPEVVLFDIGMPKLNGYEACRLIRKEPWGRKVIVIAVTGWGQDDDRQRSHDAGFDHHMVKPVDPQALMKMLAELQVAKV